MKLLKKFLILSNTSSFKQIAEIVGIDPRRVSDIHRNLYSDEGKFLGRGIRRF